MLARKLDDWEDRYRYLIELGRTLDPLDDSGRTPAVKVRGCASQGRLITRTQGEGPGERGTSEFPLPPGQPFATPRYV